MCYTVHLGVACLVIFLEVNNRNKGFVQLWHPTKLSVVENGLKIMERD